MKSNTIIDAPQEWQFTTCEGRQIKNIAELASAFKEMSNDAFKHHVDGSRNDFAQWTKDVFGDRRLARDLTRSKTLSTSLRKVEARLAEIE